MRLDRTLTVRTEAQYHQENRRLLADGWETFVQVHDDGSFTIRYGGGWLRRMQNRRVEWRRRLRADNPKETA